MDCDVQFTSEWTLETKDGRIVQLLDNDQADPMQ